MELCTHFTINSVNFMIFSLPIIHNHDRMSSSTTHTMTWVYFTEGLAGRFIQSPKVVKEEIMTDINDLVQEFSMTSSDEAVGESFIAMRRLLEILNSLKVSFDIITFFATANDLADKNAEPPFLAISRRVA